MATETKWFYAQGRQQTGPVSPTELKDLVARGQIGPADMVWREGMRTWLAAREVAELMPLPNSDGVTVTQPIAVGYYTSTLGIPPRAAANLRGHASPRGDIGDWPLDDVRIDHFEETVKLRKRISAAAGLYKLLLALTAISFTIFLLVGVSQMFSASRSARSIGMATLPVVGIMLALAVLYYLAERATRKSRRWAPLTMFILFIGSSIFQIVSFGSTVSARGSGMGAGPGLGVALFITLLFAVAFAYVSWQAFAAIPKYLAQPAWCQELVVKAGL